MGFPWGVALGVGLGLFILSEVTSTSPASAAPVKPKPTPDPLPKKPGSPAVDPSSPTPTPATPPSGGIDTPFFPIVPIVDPAAPAPFSRFTIHRNVASVVHPLRDFAPGDQIVVLIDDSVTSGSVTAVLRVATIASDGIDAVYHVEDIDKIDSPGLYTLRIPDETHFAVFPTDVFSIDHAPRPIAEP